MINIDRLILAHFATMSWPSGMWPTETAMFIWINHQALTKVHTSILSTHAGAVFLVFDPRQKTTFPVKEIKLSFS